MDIPPFSGVQEKTVLPMITHTVSIITEYSMNSITECIIFMTETRMIAIHPAALPKMSYFGAFLSLYDSTASAIMKSSGEIKGEAE